MFEAEFILMSTKGHGFYGESRLERLNKLSQTWARATKTFLIKEIKVQL